MTFSISRFSSLVDLLPSYESISWLDLVTLLSEPRRSPCTHKTCSQATCPYRQGACWSPGRQCVRAGLGVEELTLLVLDVDRAAEDQVDEIRGKLVDLQYLCHSTHSDRPNSRCLRFVFPLSRAVSADAWPRFWRAARQSLVPIADLVHWDVSRIDFLPSCPHDASYFVQVNEGSRLDVDAVLDARKSFELGPRAASSSFELEMARARGASQCFFPEHTHTRPLSLPASMLPERTRLVERRQRLPLEAAYSSVVADQPPPIATGCTELSVASQQWRAGRDASAGGGTLEADGEDNKTVSLAKTPVGGEAP
jgi:hypothetical protein